MIKNFAYTIAWNNSVCSLISVIYDGFSSPDLEYRLAPVHLPHACKNSKKNTNRMWEPKNLRSFQHSLSLTHLKAVLVYLCKHTCLFCLFSLSFTFFFYSSLILFFSLSSFLPDIIDLIILHKLFSVKCDLYYLLVIFGLVHFHLIL